MAIVGRNKEINELNNLYNSGKAEFLVVYGRRRVGKTFLIDESMDGKITFRHAGLSPVEIENLQLDEQQRKSILKQQLKHFYISLQRFGMKRSHQPTSWLEAFFMLSQLLESLDNGKRQVVFWMSCHGSTLRNLALSWHSRVSGTRGLATGGT